MTTIPAERMEQSHALAAVLQWNEGRDDPAELRAGTLARLFALVEELAKTDPEEAYEAQKAVGTLQACTEHPDADYTLDGLRELEEWGDDAMVRAEKQPRRPGEQRGTPPLFAIGEDVGAVASGLLEELTE